MADNYTRHYDENLPVKYAAQIKLLSGLRKFLNDCFTRELTVTMSFGTKKDEAARYRMCNLKASDNQEFNFSIRKDKL